MELNRARALSFVFALRARHLQLNLPHVYEAKNIRAGVRACQKIIIYENITKLHRVRIVGRLAQLPKL